MRSQYFQELSGASHLQIGDVLISMFFIRIGPLEDYFKGIDLNFKNMYLSHIFPKSAVARFV
jgi:hypothetical protein